MRIVFDTNILARAHHLSYGPARKALLHVAAGPDVLILSQYLLQELERVLAYPRLLKRTGLAQAGIAGYLEYLASVATLVDPAAVPPEILHDSADEPVLGTALAGRAEALCTRDAHFFDARVRSFCASHGIRILTDTEFLREYASKI